ncbi:hypothetical protein CFC21_076139 [Triticum aestivum]|uniref:Reticulon domain-containing protein n=3 Tax=Triticinae TaxID=1648030 RepID=A0A453JT59_AEGTS|nr:reticulon-like protein B18 isoform X2 [Aegilops tauschii subsp. strangulata]XP_044395319.1 reticulon-like protein B18 isoform X2 [Triticum aestivum]KAF7070656.1 hypothetical protein CFC21_076139 [Triticum aestivum]
MAAMAMNPTSPAPSAKLRTPPYHHPSPAAEEEPMATPPPKPAGQRSPLPSPLQLSGGYSLHELLLLSPSPTSRRTRSGRRGAAGASVDSSLEMAGTPPRRRRATPTGASPRNARRARRRLEKEAEPEEEAVRKARRRRSSRVASKVAAAVAVDKAVAAAAAAPEKEDGMSLALVPASADATHVTGTDALEQSGWESLWERVVELVMWKDVAKSALWFGLGSMFFLSCSFSREITFSPISVFCQLGVMILGLAFFKDSVPQRQPVRERNFQLTEKDVLRAAGAVLPIANSIISTAQVIFSGNPSMTLKVLPVLLFGAKYGSLVTVWRLLATGFFTSFTLPKLYICYSTQIHMIAENLIDRALEAWKSCPRKKFVAGTAVIVCWNLFSVKTRFVAAFISVVILRYNHQTAGLV